MAATPDELVYFNGIDGETGQYAVAPKSISDIASAARREELDSAEFERQRAIRHQKDEATYGWPDRVDIKDMRTAGWALVFHQDEDPEVRKRFEPLFEHRRAEIGNDKIVKILTVGEGEDYRGWLSRHGAAAGTPRPERVPCYLLIVGSPTRIPFNFSRGLSVEYLPGRLWFEQPVDYATYVKSLIDYERGAPPQTGKEAAFFAPHHEYDTATRLGLNRLVRPLAGLQSDNDGGPLPSLRERPVAEELGFRQQYLLGEQATKAGLTTLIHPPGDGKAPALLFTTSHGMVFAPSNGRQRSEQGALLCQDWPQIGTVPRPEHYFAAADVPADARIHGMVAFFFACYGGGTPRFDRFFGVDAVLRELAPEPFFSALPLRLLAHEGGGALACIAHVDRAWASSFHQRLIADQIEPFYTAVERILSGRPVGLALRDFGDRYATLSTSISQYIMDIKNEERVDDQDLTWAWIERNDAEGYVVIGDPAARLRVNDLT